MRINFRQGIISYPVSGSAQAFLVKTGNYVTLQASSRPVEVAFAHKDTDYLLTESADMPNAWGPLPANTDCWLYWDIDRLTGVRTFGYTTVEPDYDDQIIAGTDGMHWFNSTDNVMNAYFAGAYHEVVRVFAAKVNNSTFSGLGVGFPSRPFAGSQVGDYTPNVTVGHIIADSTGSPIRRNNGTFFTTESDFFVNGSPINPIRLEATIVNGAAQEMMAKFQVVKFSDFGELHLAGYNDIQTTTIAMLMEDLSWFDVGNVCIQGLITNPDWDWTVVGAPLWVSEGGVLTETDPHVANALVYPTSKPAVARVVTPTSIIFDQGLGGKGDRGEKGVAGGVALASTTSFGVVRMSTAPADADNPIAVSDNDTRLSNKVLKAGDTMTGPLVLNADPVVALGAATKQYVDSIDLTSRVAKAGDTMTGPLVLNADPTLALHAATKQYVDSIDLTSRVAKAGDTMTGPLVLNADPVVALGAATKQYVDNRIVPYDLTLMCSDTTNAIATKTNAAYAIAPRAFTTAWIRADVLTSSSSGDVVAEVLVNGSPVSTLTVPALSLTVTNNIVLSIAQSDKISVNITGAGTNAVALLITISGAV